jgi:pilus assembly protein CpaE
VVPYDAKAAANAAKLGQTFLGANRSAKAALAMKEVAQAIASLSEESDDAAVPGKTKAKAKPTSLLGKLDFKKMLPAKGKTKAGAPA